MLGYPALFQGVASPARSARFANPPAVPASLDGLALPELKTLRDRLRVKVAVLLLTTPAAAARPETWQSLAEQFAAARNASKGDEGAVLASIDGLLDVVTGLSMGGQPKVAGAVA